MFFISFCTLGSETQSTTAHKKRNHYSGIQAHAGCWIVKIIRNFNAIFSHPNTTNRTIVRKNAQKTRFLQTVENQ